MYFLLAFACCATILCTLSPCVQCKGVDLTLKPGAVGSSVVHACIDKIAAASIKFKSPDQQLLRRIAYVESRDGTYHRASNDFGGIWRLSSAKFDKTKRVSTTILNAIKKAPLKITWANTKWSDLRKPLYSALAARLYLEVISQTIPLATNIKGQGNYWNKYYTNSEGTALKYKIDVDQLNKDEECKVSGLDMIFVMDESGSVTHSNFQKMKSFVYRVVEAFNVEPDSVRVGVLAYASSYRFHFHLNTYSSKSTILSAIKNLPYSGGGTNTAGAINAVRTIGFTTGKGARPANQAVPRIAIIITDGYSNSYPATVSAAAAMHKDGIIGFAVGISGANMKELNKMASDPSYVAFISNFDSNLLNNLQVTLSQETCKASTNIPSGTGITDTVEEGEIKYINYPLPKDYAGITVKVNATAGTCVVYGSTVIHAPNDALYEVKLITNRYRDAYVPQDKTSTARTLYLAIKSGPNVNCTVTINIDKGDTSTGAIVDVVLFPSTDIKLPIKSVFTARCIVTANALPTVKWYKNKKLIQGSSGITLREQFKITSFLTISSLSKNDEGTYECVGSTTGFDGEEVTDSKSFDLTVTRYCRN